jgi:hypothetical protein
MAFTILDKSGNLKQTIGILSAASFPALTGDVTTVAGALATTVVGASGLFNISGASAGQIKFPATQNPSSDVNTLDDYEEGTWTPVIGGSTSESGQAYTYQLGRYQKVGRMVTAFCIVQLLTKGTITGFVQIKGLPFACETLTNFQLPVTMSYFENLATNWSSLAGTVLTTATAAFIGGVGAAATGITLLQTADISNTTQLIFSVSYFAAA